MAVYTMFNNDLEGYTLQRALLMLHLQVVDEYELNGGCHYCFLPCTYGPGYTGVAEHLLQTACAWPLSA